MKSTVPITTPSQEIPEEIFELFLAELEKKGAAPEVVQGLRNTLLTEKTLTETAIRNAIFSQVHHP